MILKVIAYAAFFLPALLLVAPLNPRAAADAAGRYSQDLRIPRDAYKFQAALTRAARAEIGLASPLALLAAQVHQESRWDAGAVSPAGAQGLAQFMPATARWLPRVHPGLGKPMPYNPGWALRAMCAYDAWLYARIRADNAFERWAFTLSAYNGGLGWVYKDQALAYGAGHPPGRWFGGAELCNAGRSRAAFAENRGYPRRILLEIMPVYQAAGWGPGVNSEEGESVQGDGDPVL